MNRPFLLSVAVLAAAFACPPAYGQPRPGPVLARDLVVQEFAPGFSYSWTLAPQAGLQPVLAHSLRREAEAQLRADRAEAARLAASPSGAGWWRQTDWQASADTPRLLALWSRTSLLSGGAHGNLAFQGLWWDKRGQRRLTMADITQNPGAAFSALSSAFCPALDTARQVKRQGQAMELPAFNQCPDVAKQTLVPMAIGPNRRIALFSVKVAPYEAGPYSEGTYEVTIPVTAAFVAALRSEWRDQFRVP